MSWNVHSLRKRFIDILHYTRQEKPDIICLQEALHGHNKFFIRGYTKYEHNTSQGLVIYVCNNLPHEIIENSPTLYNNDGNTYMLLKVNIKDMLFSFKNKYHYTYPNVYIALYNSHAKVTCNTHTPKNKKLLTIPLKLLPSLANYPPLLSPLPLGSSPPLTQN